ncbi:hypothetical protein [Palleronia sp.]|uniref:hypothetical protein n=1 Tax=Palleronia sp. TaxID=1940284 RepID=UPI0035C81A15
MSKLRLTVRIAALGALMATAAMPAYAISLPAADEADDTPASAGMRPLPRPVGFGASDLAPELVMRPPLRGTTPVLADPAEETLLAEAPENEPTITADASDETETPTEPTAAHDKVAENDREPVDPFARLHLARIETFSIDTDALDAVRQVKWDDERSVLPGVVDHAALEGFVLSEEHIWRQPLTAVQIASREMRSAIRERLTARYDLQNGEAGDIERLYALADGQAMRDYGAPRPKPVEPAAMKVVEARFEAPVRAPAPAPAPVAPKAADLRSFLNTPDGIAALAKMDAAQISALTEMLRTIEGTGASAKSESPADAPKTVKVPGMPGVPALSFRRTASSPAAETEPRTLGGSNNLLLRDWQVTDEGGRVSLFRQDAPASRIAIAEGMIVGALGAIVEIDRSGGEIRVRFESGDEISGSAS